MPRFATLVALGLAAPAVAGDSAGTHLQRCLGLMASSTPTRRNTVRVLFYGQSITQQDWWKYVAEGLRRRYPHANLVVENRAIGGFPAEFLVKTAETDLYPFEPDLLIFHAYGSHFEYENIIRRVRERTVADVLMQTDHLDAAARLDEETDPARLKPADGHAWMNHVFLPTTAVKYGCELADVRAGWKKHLRANNLTPQDLLKDAVHLNARGEGLMAALVSPHLTNAPAKPPDDGRATTFVVGRDVHWQGDTLTLDFDGTRVEAVCKPGRAAPAAVRIDGRKPSETSFAWTRTTPYPGSILPSLLRVAAEAPPVAEEWVLTIRDAKPDLTGFNFTVRGSVTGDDGEGRADTRFVSRSKRVVIDPADWFLFLGRRVSGKTLPADFVVRWTVLAQGVDAFVSPGVADPTVETTVSLARGLPNGKHRLTIAGAPDVPIAALRVYRPPLQPGG